MNTEETKDSIDEVARVWVAWTDSDLIEGEGVELPLAVCWSKSTAARLGRGKGVQGMDCPITQDIAIHINGRRNDQWYVPGHVINPTFEDSAANRICAKHKAAFKKAMKAGLTYQDIKDLGLGRL